ncbi:tRNA (adenosine(37)-N6)-threonylcarbamoyltransferase complex ATPase subunit type 1 TsaE [Hyunsoonleella sp. SJ7]|uniref:tRNA threonylcarbamoyladenosine biosynthesis protein TsaE n=1 Tax=Hyunsoonleella aquatilis TaxID=2762758 RepID=A0A923KLL8_9FLAO|nr:tRNA (adenosine(37)-N6)-threonylcarbamoyltransferase complex ATPase subunit type 1 TsaE [Hyunsoonleella aquatilis]MBC3758963.1 tRNA (adenosine(37)-N6)-threonylcarbamoyltransferase complex ATPase subunit type 1 TsaE [Hyunsoonleella aquatilis]
MKITYELHEVDDVALKLLEQLSSKIVLLYGTMGTGKTTLVKSLTKALGSTNEASSPTFSIVNEYEADNGLIYHFDLYRINDLEEAYNFGIEDYLFSNHWILIEWPELIEPILPENFNKIYLDVDAKDVRILSLE